MFVCVSRSESSGVVVVTRRSVVVVAAGNRKGPSPRVVFFFLRTKGGRFVLCSPPLPLTSVWGSLRVIQELTYEIISVGTNMHTGSRYLKLVY